MISFLKWDHLNDMYGWQMWPLKDAAFEMRHGYSLNIEAEFMQLDRHKLEHLILKHVRNTPKSY